jgi:hypothetical protein
LNPSETVAASAPADEESEPKAAEGPRRASADAEPLADPWLGIDPLPPPTDAPLLDGIPRQPGVAPSRASLRSAACGMQSAPSVPSVPSVPESVGPAPCPTAEERVRRWAQRVPRVWRVLPTPLGTPLTFGYALVLLLTSLFAEYGEPGSVSALLRASSTDIVHLAQQPGLVLVASALWIAGGITSPYAVAFLLVLTALERQIGAVRTAGVFLLGHMVATLATELPVGLSVLAGHLPGSSLRRFDYGISFGVTASVGALAGLLTPWLRWSVLAGVGWMLLDDLMAFTDPMTEWGHVMAFGLGIATWPWVRRRRRS